MSIRDAFEKWKDYLWIVIGELLQQPELIFYSSYKIAPGGVNGIATVLYHLSGKLPVGTTMLALNIPLFILGYRFIGKKFIIKDFFWDCTSFCNYRYYKYNWR